uniref:Exocyst complex component 2 n=1 Tax=Cacopsylla melanoneura TaxID=428564 RepID=A0A8D8SKL0_9HEMI
MAPPPVVTGISPKEGPPGTRVTIRGEYLGSKPNDLISLMICGCECQLSAEWKSPNKIIARSGPGKGRGEIIVTTSSGGEGTCTIQFRGYHETIGPLKESAVWVEEAPIQSLSWNRRSMSPSSYQLEDPLGLSVEREDRKIPEDDLHELFPDGSGDLGSENFEPTWFLLDHHHSTSFDDLRAGLSFLRRKVESQKEGQLSFLKSNVSSVMEQMDTLFLFKEKFEANVREHGLDPTIKVEQAIKKSMTEATKLFQDVLARREKADKTRNALAVLQRYRFLFSLPLSISNNIAKNDIDAVINDYARAMNLFGKTDVVLFKKVLCEVESNINDLRDMLRKKIKIMPQTLQEQKTLIRNLINLDAGGNPGWDAIMSQYEYIIHLLESSKTEHMALDAENSKPKKPKHTRSASGSHVLEPAPIIIPQPILCVEELTAIVSERFPDLWKLGQSYFSGELQGNIETNNQPAFKKIILDVVALSCKSIRSSVLPHTCDGNVKTFPTSYKESLGPHLPTALQYVCDLYSNLLALDLPTQALQIVSKLLFDLKLHTLLSSVKLCENQIKALKHEEKWQYQFNPNKGAITLLPNQFEQLIIDMIQSIKQNILNKDDKENTLLSNDLAKNQFIAEINKLLLTIVNLMDELSSGSNDQEDNMPVSQLIGSPMVYSDKQLSGTFYEERLLLTLSNCRYIHYSMFPRWDDLFIQNGLISIKDSLKLTVDSLVTLENKLIENYIEIKSDPLVGTIEPSMYLGHFDWDTNIPPSDLKPYAKEILSNIIAVHAELVRIVPGVIHKVISGIVETVAEELSRLMSCVTKFSDCGKQQAYVDMSCLKNTLAQYCNENAKDYFLEALDVIPPLSAAQKERVDEILSQFQVRMKLQLLGLSLIK